MPIAPPIPRVPHPIPYQGSKRLLAPAILGTVSGLRFRRLYEPFAGSAAITLAAASLGLAERYVLSDSLVPLVAIWSGILSAPDRLAAAYERIWRGQEGDPAHFGRVRDAFNAAPDPARLLYLLARCVKNSPRFNREGAFNQSPDRRRRGRSPIMMKRAIQGAAALLAGRAEARACDFEEALAAATAEDLVYMDPPYQGVSGSRDTRYHQGLDRSRLVAALAALVKRRVPLLLSYDGRCGEKTYGESLPDTLGLVRLEVRAGRSSQATLNGRAEETVESLYVSPAAVPRR
jgi:DNA adenine methylase